MPGYRWKCKACGHRWSTMIMVENLCPLCRDGYPKYQGEETHDLRTGGYLPPSRSKKKHKGGRKYP